MDQLWDPVLGDWADDISNFPPSDEPLPDLTYRFDDDYQDLDATEAPLTINLGSNANQKDIGSAVVHDARLYEASNLHFSPTSDNNSQPHRTQSPRSSIQRKNNQSKRQSTRFTSQQIHVLKIWLRQNAHSPYPSAAEKERLALQTKLTTRQIEVWFSNARKRNQSLVTDVHMPASGDPSFSHGQTPMERYLSSSDEEEAASSYHIECAWLGWDKTNTLLREEDSIFRDDVLSLDPTPDQSDAFSVLSQELCPMPYHRVSSASSMGSAASFGSRQGRRRHASYSSQADLGSKRLHPCAHCPKKFKTAYDCRRHEKSIHLGTERWMCRLHEVDMPQTGPELPSAASDDPLISATSAKTDAYRETHSEDMHLETLPEYHDLFHDRQAVESCKHPPTLVQCISE